MESARRIPRPESRQSRARVDRRAIALTPSAQLPQHQLHTASQRVHPTHTGHTHTPSLLFPRESQQLSRSARKRTTFMYCRRLASLCGHVQATVTPDPSSADAARLSVKGTGRSALGPDPWTNTPDGKGSGGGPLPSRLVMTDEELYLFDLHGYLVVPQALSQDTVALLNQHVDANTERVHTRNKAGSLDGTNEPIHGGVAAPAMTGTHGRGDFNGYLWDWGEPAGAAFRALIANEHAMRIAIGVIGDAFRLAGTTGLTQTKGAEGFVLHGGGNPDNMFAVRRQQLASRLSVSSSSGLCCRWHLTPTHASRPCASATSTDGSPTRLVVGCATVFCGLGLRSRMT